MSGVPDVGAGWPPDRTTAFVARRDELDLLRAADGATAAAGRAVVVVEGRAGSGKTTLVAEFLSGVPIDARLHAVASPDERGVPFGVVEQLVSALTRRPIIEVDHDPARVGAALVECLGERAADVGRLVVVVEDLQWIDRASQRALAFALRRLRGDAILAVLTCRPPVADDIVRLAAPPSGAIVSLRDFTPDEVGELAAASGAGPLTPHSARRLWRHTGGLPLHVVELCTQLDSATLQRLDQPLPVPRSYERLVVDRLAACPSDAADLTRAVAVLGGRSSLALAAGVAGLAGPDDALAALGAARTERLLAERIVATGIEVQLTHPLATAAVLDEAGADRRGVLRRRAAAVAEAGGDITGALRQRAAAAIGPDDELAATLADHGDTLLDEQLPVAAAEFLLLAARLSTGPERDERLARAVELWLLDGDVAAAEPHAAEVAAQPDSARRRLVLAQLAELSGHQLDAAAHLSQGWALRDTAPAEVAARLALLGGQMALREAEAGDAAMWARRALSVDGDDEMVIAEATGLLVRAMGMLGEGSEGLLLVADTPERPSEAVDLPCLLARGIVRVWTGELHGAVDDLTAVVEDSHPWRPLRLRLTALGCLAKAEYRLGRWDDCVAHAGFAVSLAEDADHLWSLGFLHSVAALVPAVRGSWDEAEHHVAAAGAAAARLGGMGADRANAARAAAQLAFARSDPAAVIAAVEPALELFRRDGYAEPGVMPWRELYAMALVYVGRLEDAAAALAGIERVDAVSSNPYAKVSASRVRAHLAAARGELDEAARVLSGALETLEGVVAPFERALLDDAHGRVLRRSGRRRDAAASLERAFHAYEGLGAAPFLARIERELAACGLRPRRRTGTAPEGLTPQELTVARLVAQGHTNREIAAELIISVKTVEYHMGNIFVKLGIGSRRELRHRSLDE